MPQTIRATIDWEKLKNSKKPVAIALRIAPFPRPFGADDLPARHVVGTAKSLLAAAHAHEVELSEFQLYFDCAERKLDGYRARLQALVPVIRPRRVVITSLAGCLQQP